MTVSVADSSQGTVRKAIYSNEASLCKALDNCRLDWTFDGQAAWFGQDETFIFHRSAAQSGDIGDSQTSSIETTVNGPGNLSFYGKVSSEEGYDNYSFFIDDELQGTEISGEIDWTKEMYSLEGGTHTLKWQYSKDSSLSEGSDCVWLDKVRWPNESELSPGPLNLLMLD